MTPLRVSSCSESRLVHCQPIFFVLIDPRICCLVIAPTFFSAANYTLLARLVKFTE